MRVIFSNKEQAIKEYKQSIADQDAEIAALEAAIAAEKKRILEASGTVLTYDGGVFKFPLASYTRISDDYGNRIHPTLGIEQFHNGVVSPHRKEQRSMQPTTAKWWQPPTAIPWGTTS